MRAAGESTYHTSAAGDLPPAAVNSARGEPPRATGTSAASASDITSRNRDESEIELIYSGESHDVSDSKATPQASVSPEADTARARLTVSGKRGGITLENFGSSDCSEESPPHASPSSDRTRGDGGDTPIITTSEVTRRIEVSLVSVIVLTPIKRPGTEMSCATLLNWSSLDAFIQRVGPVGRHDYLTGSNFVIRL
uniref:Uncharacterized protein n=1 Tax=Peronospora matthiolae TaxID=2874970 RepID=A0AAV1V296_9STRA